MKHYALLLSILITVPIIAHHKSEEFEVPLTEDLMREHGILNRILLIYEEVIYRIDHNQDFPADALLKAVDIIKTFIEEHHEHMEERYLFPLFEHNNQEVALVKTLKIQHTKGREITDTVQQLLSNPLTLEAKQAIRNSLKNFITMYRPHEAREDTVIFPKIREFLSDEEFDELGETFELLEHELLGENGFENIVQTVEDIEKALDIYVLEQFTPKFTRCLALSSYKK